MVSLAWAKFRSSIVSMGIRWMWAWGTSRPATIRPIRLQGWVSFRAAATFLAKGRIPARVLSVRSKNSSVGVLGITKV